ncbi:MAG: outer membrane lipoprotein-sorting protein [Limnochordales bacterium]|nr:outer membrane lipoprotein-sorting protein [Limnochordales bacterium]
MKKVGFVTFSLICCGLALALSTPARAELSGTEIIKRYNEMGSVMDMSAEIEMRIISKSGQERVRQLTIVSKRGDDATRKVLLRFLSPADVKGTAFLSISGVRGEDENWLYLPALGKPRRIASEERSNSFMGSDFTYADIGLLKIDDYRHTLLRTERLGNEEVYVVESVPVSDKVRRADGFAKKIWWIRKSTFTLARAEFLDNNGKVIKVLTGSDVVDLGSGAWLSSRLEMQNLTTGSRTIITFKNIKVNSGIPDDYFTTRELTRTSR